MKITMFLLTLVFVGSANASSALSSILDGYAGSDVNQKCHVTVAGVGTITKVSISSKSRQNLSLNFSEAGLLQVGDTYVLQEQDSPGIATALLVRQPYKLIVSLMWEDREGGKDLSSFCELPLLSSN